MAGARFQIFRVSGDSVGWRLVAPNNRELARGVDMVEDEHTARLVVADLKASLATANRSVRPDADGRWRWVVEVDGSEVAKSSRCYYRRLECAATLAQFLELSRHAAVVEAVATFRTGDPSWRSADQRPRATSAGLIPTQHRDRPALTRW